MAFYSKKEFVSRVWCIKIVSPQEVQQPGKQGVKVLDPVQIQKPSDSSYTPSQQESRNLGNGVTSVGSLEYGIGVSSATNSPPSPRLCRLLRHKPPSLRRHLHQRQDLYQRRHLFR
ncbi:hypothetical protein Hdeb2414_s0010g00348301 [Helianthus debilis subsp. tardiflorus]